MGFLDRIFGNSNSIENKMAIYLALFSNIAQADGHASQSEIMFSRQFLGNIPGADKITEKQWGEILKKSDNLGDKVQKEALKLNDKNKAELLDYLIGAAAADGKIDANEISYIMIVSTGLGMDTKNIIDNLNKNYTIDPEEIEKSTNYMIDLMKSQGYKV